jgi:hypothetical protein
MRIRTLALAGAAAAAVAYVFDPVRGEDRRRRLATSTRELVDRRRVRTAPPDLPENVAPRPSQISPHAGTTTPIPMAASPQPERPGAAVAGDAELVRRVRGTLRARHDLRADDLVIDVVNGVAYLSGDLHDGHTFGEIVDLTRDVPGVRRVQSLLHLPDSETVSRAISSGRVGDEASP